MYHQKKKKKRPQITDQWQEDRLTGYGQKAGAQLEQEG